MVFILACAQTKESSADIAVAETYHSNFSAYQTWEQPQGWEGLQASQSVHGAAVKIFWNPLASTAFSHGDEIPDGGAIIKEVFADETGTELQGLVLMVKRSGFDPQAGD